MYQWLTYLKSEHFKTGFTCKILEHIHRTDVHDIILTRQQALVSYLSFRNHFLFVQNFEPVFVKKEKESYYIHTINFKYVKKKEMFLDGKNESCVVKKSAL